MRRLICTAAAANCAGALFSCGGQVTRTTPTGSGGSQNTSTLNATSAQSTWIGTNGFGATATYTTTSDTPALPPIVVEPLDPSVLADGSGGDATRTADSAVSDAPVNFDVTPAPQGLAGFAFVVNGVVQTPLNCPSDNWEFAPPPNSTCGVTTSPPFACPGITSVVLANTGQVPMAYLAAALWSGQGHVPGVLTGDPYQLAGVLGPGAQVDITSVYNGGVVATLGSSEPFSLADAGKYLSDEGVISWPAGVSGSGGATQMEVAEIEIRTSCGMASVVW